MTEIESDLLDVDRLGFREATAIVCMTVLGILCLSVMEVGLGYYIATQEIARGVRLNQISSSAISIEKYPNAIWTRIIGGWLQALITSMAATVYFRSRSVMVPIAAGLFVCLAGLMGGLHAGVPETWYIPINVALLIAWVIGGLLARPWIAEQSSLTDAEHKSRMTVCPNPDCDLLFPESRPICPACNAARPMY